MKRPWDAIVWWEIRRVPYNAVLAIVGVATTAVVLWLGSYLAPDVGFAPLGLIVCALLYGLGANVFYTLGWISELLWSGGDTSRTEGFRKRVFYAGLVASCLLTMSPAVLMPALWLMFSVRNGSP